MPGYKAISIQKEISHLLVSNKSDKAKEEEEKRIPLNNPDFLIVGKSRCHESVQKLGLVPHQAAYRILPSNF